MSDDDDREAILARRRRWIAIALAGASTTACVTAQPCLRVAIDSGSRDAGSDTNDAQGDDD
jgi:hypothetical protein